jgi:hypothetical protein
LGLATHQVFRLAELLAARLAIPALLEKLPSAQVLLAEGFLVLVESPVLKAHPVVLPALLLRELLVVLLAALLWELLEVLLAEVQADLVLLAAQGVQASRSAAQGVQAIR